MEMNTTTTAPSSSRTGNMLRASLVLFEPKYNPSRVDAPGSGWPLSLSPLSLLLTVIIILLLHVLLLYHSTSSSIFPGMSRRRIPASLLLFLLPTILLLLISGAQLVAAQTTCDATSGGGSGVLTRTGDSLGSTAFAVNAGCVGLTLDGCTADNVTLPALSGVAVVVKNLACSDTTGPGTCITFNSTVSGGSIDINGVSRMMSGRADGNYNVGGPYSVVSFNGAVSNVDSISIKGIVLTLDSLNTVGNTNIYVVFASDTVTGDSAAGSSFNVSDCIITSGSTITTATGSNAVSIYVLHTAGRVSGFERVEVSGHTLSGVSVFAGGPALLALFHPQGGITLTGTANSSIILGSNIIKGSSVVSANSAQLVLFYGPYDDGNDIDAASSIIVNAADMRDCTVASLFAYSGAFARFFALFFFLTTGGSTMLTLVHDGRISINNAWIGGEMTYSQTTNFNGYGARILNLYSINVGIKEISATNCVIDMNKNKGMQVSSSMFGDVVARVLHLQTALDSLASIAANNCSIRGNYSSAQLGVSLHILYTFDSLVADIWARRCTVSITDSEVATTLPVLTDGPIQFLDMTGIHVVIKNLGCGDVSSMSTNGFVLDCVLFESTISGGSINIDGLRRTISSNVVGAYNYYYNMVHFMDEVGGVNSIVVKGIVLTLDSLNTAGDTHIYGVYTLYGATGDGFAGSTFNISDCTISAGSSVTTSTGSAWILLLCTESKVRGFEFFEMSGNKMADVSATAAKFVEVAVVSFSGTLTLTGSANSSIIFGCNSVRGSSAVSTDSGAAEIHLLDAGVGTNTIDGVSSIIVNGADMRDCTVTSGDGQYALLTVVTSQILTLVHGGKITINNAWLGGEMTYQSTSQWGCGALILNLLSSSSTGIKEISATHCFIDMSKNDGTKAWGPYIDAVSQVIYIKSPPRSLAVIAASNCSIRGKYRSDASTVDLHILRVDSGTLSAATVSISDSEVATAAPVIENGPVQFGGAVSSSNIIIRNLGCGDAASPSSKCVYFVSTITGGSVDIDGLRRTITGSAAGTYYMVNFNGAVSAVTGIAVKGIVLTLSSLSTAGNTHVYPFYAASTVAGDSSAGSALNVSNCEITSGSSLTTSSGSLRMWLAYTVGCVSGFETLELSGNSLDNISMSSVSQQSNNYQCTLMLFSPQGGIRLAGTASAAIILRGNTMRRNDIVASAAQVLLLSGPTASGKNISGVSSIIVDGADMRDCTVSAVSETAVVSVLSLSLALAHGGKISINNALIGGEMTYSATSSGGYGANILNLFSSVASGIKEISATNCLIDMSKNKGMHASGVGVNANVRVLDLNPALSGLTSIAATNCSIRGKYSSGSSTVELHVLYAASTLSAATVSVTDSEVVTSRPVIENGPVRFGGAVSSSNIIIRNLGCGSTNRLAPGCVFFTSTVNGGSINIDGLRRIVSGTTAGTYSMVMFNSGMSAVSGISIKGIVLTLDSLNTVGNTNIYVVFASDTVTGDSAAGSSFNVSDCIITSGSTITTATGSNAVSIYVLHTAGRVSGFERVEVSGHTLSGVSVFAGGPALLALFHPRGGITLTGTANSSIILRENSVNGAVVASTVNGNAQFALFLGSASSGKDIEDISSLIVNGADMRDCTVTAASGQWARVAVLYLHYSPTLTLTNGGRISINNAWISGEMSYGLTKTGGYGATILCLDSTSSGIEEISASNCVVDMSKNKGMHASGVGVVAIARVLDFKNALSGLTSITATNCSIRGKYSSGSSTVELHVLHAGSTLSAATVSVADSEVATTTPVIQYGPLQFVGAVSDTNIKIRNLGCGDTNRLAPGCVFFTSTVNGGSINIDGLRRIVSGSAAGVYNMVKFNNAVSGMSGISIKGIVLTLDTLITSSHTQIFLVFAASTIAGDSSAGSAFNVSNCEITSGSSVTTSSGSSRMSLVYTSGLLSGFETLELSGNKLDGVTLTAAQDADMPLANGEGGITLTGSANSAIVLQNNTMKSSSVFSTNAGFAQIILFLGTSQSGKNVAGVKSIIVDGADLQDCTVTAGRGGQFARLFALMFFPGASLTLVNDGRININNVRLGGAMKYSSSGGGYGANILNLFSSVASGIKEISATNCLIDMSKNNGLHASGVGVAAIARVLDLNTAVRDLSIITASNCSIRGKYISANSVVQLHFLQLFKAPAPRLRQLTITRNSFDLQRAAAPKGFDVAFVGVYASSIDGGTLRLIDNSFSSSVTLFSSGGPICVGGLRAVQSLIVSFNTKIVDDNSFNYAALTTDKTAAAASQYDVEVHCGNHSGCEQLHKEDCLQWVGRKACKWCSDSQRCVQPSSSACRCSVLSQTECKFSSLGAAGACRYCQMVDMCLEPPGVDPNLDSCSCAVLNGSLCEKTRRVAGFEGGCKFCSKTSKCADAEAVTECGCDGMPLDQCSWTSNGGGTAQQQCAISPETSLCYVNNSMSQCRLLNQQNCSSSFFSTAANSKDHRCHFCRFPALVTVRGASPASSHCLPLSSGVSAYNQTETTTEQTSCDCGYVPDEADCKSSAPSCRWNSFGPKNIVGGKPFCSQSTPCSALTCEGILSAAACNASGCQWEQGKCVPGKGGCFAFMLDGFLAMTVLQLFVGVIRDVLVLFALGAFGDFILRPLRRFWRQRCDKGSALEDRVDETIYILDDEVKDGVAMSFEEYVQRVTEKFFSFESRNPSQKHRAQLNTAVAFAIYAQRLWIPIEDGGDRVSNENAAEQDDEEAKGSLSEEQRRKQQQHATLFSTDFDDTQALKNLAYAHARHVASHRVYVSTSRHALRRIAAVTVDNPSRIQLMGYSMGILAMVATTIYDVFFKKKNFDLVTLLANPKAGCDIAPGNTSTSGGNATSTSSASNGDASTASAGAILATAFLLSCWRIANSSTASTGLLVMVKVARAFWRLRSPRFTTHLSLSEQLAIMSLSQSGMSKALLVVYFFLLMPFLLVGVLYGLPSGVALPVIVPLSVGAGFLLLQFGIIRLIQRRRPTSSTSLPTATNDAENEDDAPGPRPATTENEAESLVHRQQQQQLTTSNLRSFAKLFDQPAARRAPLAIESAASEAETILPPAAASLAEHATAYDDEAEALPVAVNASTAAVTPSAAAAAVDVDWHSDRDDDDAPREAARLPVFVNHSQRFTGIFSDVEEEQRIMPAAATATGEHEQPLLEGESEKEQKQRPAAAAAAAPGLTDFRRFLYALCSFLLNQQFVVIVLAAVLQATTNATCLLHFAHAFGLEENPPAGSMQVFEQDWQHRSVRCTLDKMGSDVSKVSSDLSAVLPFA